MERFEELFSDCLRGKISYGSIQTTIATSFTAGEIDSKIKNQLLEQLEVVRAVNLILGLVVRGREHAALSLQTWPTVIALDQAKVVRGWVSTNLGSAASAALEERLKELRVAGI